MKQIRVVFETDGQKIGYVLDAETQRFTSGKFDENCKEIIEKTQDGVIDNPEELCKQIYFVLIAGIKNG